MDDDELYTDPEGLDCVTARQAARITGRNIQTIYSWQRRGLIAPRMTDDRGLRVYLLADICAAAGHVAVRAQRVFDSRTAA
ncbi:MerR family transcriptional regulator [Kitasatospora sp. NPDC059646]|uniref:MerR family transcriptional regulator n=1 Tax=Kitasatospora sp. NPDC059646 TaxID=3346893 RepID=UPI003673D929